MVIRRELQSNALCKQTIKVAIDFKLCKHFSNHAWDVLSDISVWNQPRIASRNCCFYWFNSIECDKKMSIKRWMWLYVSLSLSLSHFISKTITLCSVLCEIEWPMLKMHLVTDEVGGRERKTRTRERERKRKSVRECDRTLCQGHIRIVAD